MKTIIVKVPHTNAREKALLRLGFKSESYDESGPVSSICDSARSMKIWRSDGREMTTGDIRAVRAVLKA